MKVKVRTGTRRLIMIILAFLMVSCANDYAKSMEVVAPTTIAPTQPAVTRQLPPVSVTNPTSDPQTNSTPSPTSRPTAVPVVRLAVPEIWQYQVNVALATSVPDHRFEWQIVEESAESDLQIEEGSGAYLAGEQPISLTVPFIYWNDAVTLQEAEEILASPPADIEVHYWREKIPATKSLRVEGKLPFEPGYPLQSIWHINFEATFREAAEVLSDLLQSSRQPGTIHVSAVGDIMLDRSLGAAIRREDIAYPFIDVAEKLRSADITFGNLESALGESGEPETKHYTFLSPPAAAEALGGAGFDLVSLANNHAMDYGPETLLEGIALLARNSIQTVGAGADSTEARKPATIEIDGVRIAFLGYVNVPVEVGGFDTASWEALEAEPGVAWARQEHIIQDVAAARLDHDVVVVLLHSGFEYIEEPGENQITASRAAIDAGADLVIGHHTHVLQGVEFYKEGVIVYGLGNFAFEIDGDPSTAILDIWLDQEGIRQIEFVPAVIQFGGQPRLAEPFESSAIRDQIYFLTALLN